MTTLKGSFTNSIIEGAKAAGLEGSGSLTLGPDGSLRAMCRLSRVWLARTVGVVAVLVTLVAVATVPVILDDVFGWDLMEVRKGPVFIAMVALVAMFTAWSAATSLVDRILGRRVELAIPGTHVRSLTPSEHHVTVVFDDEAGVPTYLSFWADRKSRAAVAQLPRRAEQ